MSGSGATKPPEQHSERLTSVAISIDSKHGSYRLLSGQRLEQFENDYFVPKARSVFGPVGEAALVSADNETELPPERFAPDDAKTFEIELACITPETTTEAERILRLFFDEEVAHSILDLGLREALVWWSPVEIGRASCRERVSRCV